MPLRLPTRVGFCPDRQAARAGLSALMEEHLPAINEVELVVNDMAHKATMEKYPQDADRDALFAAVKRVTQPLHHAVGVPKGKVTPEMMKDIANDTIKRLGLTEYQLLVYAYNDTAHPHMHFLVNRIYPRSLRAWSRTDEGRWLTTICRGIAKERGLNVARDLAAERKQQDRTRAIDDHEYRIAQRDGREPLALFDKRGILELRRAVRNDFFDATLWDDLTGRLAKKGYSLRRKGQGLVLTDGERVAKLSDLGKGVRFKELETRFDLPYDVWHSQEISRTAVDGLKAGPKTHDGMAPEEKARTKALDRVTGDMIHKARRAENRKEQLYRAWRKHQERRRQRERERAMRDLGL